ncbi:MAG: acetamidase/formamidase family protein [Deltaproteobacteria bacterium]|nr:acetamidase/formamidase family protein [Deltaproteobacteria bacterium]
MFILLGGMAMGQSSKVHKLVATPQTVHTGFFDSTIPPVLTIDSGDTVALSTMMLMDGKLRCGMTIEELMATRQTYVDRKLGPITLTGPIYINGAEPGDVLEVRIKRLVPINCGVNYHLPGRMNLGGLPEDFPNGQFKTFQLDLWKMEATFAPGIVIPLRPFLGAMGVAPKPGEKRPTAIPDYFGGNMDNKELAAGTTLYLPVNVKGGLFSTGDAHAVQGDGEVNVTAIETAIEEGILQFIVRKDMKLERPMVETPTHWIATGYHKDLNEAVKIALRDAIEFISKTKGLTRDDAYALCSLAVDLRVTQIVDVNKGIHAMIPKALFK